ncbi:MAG: signal peptidase I [Anaerovorax sp.]
MSYQQDNRPFKEKYRIYIYPVVAALIITMFWRPTVANGDAMEPGIHDGQVIIITKEKYSENRGYPKLGQVVAFVDDIAKAKVEGDNSIRRVVGLPGDKLYVKQGKLYRNGSLVKGGDTQGTLGVDMDPVTVGKEEVFVISDDGRNTADSRNEKIGPVKMNLIRGKCSLIVWPIGDFGLIK